MKKKANGGKITNPLAGPNPQAPTKFYNPLLHEQGGPPQTGVYYPPGAQDPYATTGPVNTSMALTLQPLTGGGGGRGGMRSHLRPMYDVYKNNFQAPGQKAVGFGQFKKDPLQYLMAQRTQMGGPGSEMLGGTVEQNSGMMPQPQGPYTGATFAKGGAVRRGDGICVKGRTKGRMI